ncbi:hypothetical protein [Gemmata sp.]|uniref:hypothetical protein n=1 Tax=Gemmata sp. TaxID=1914242 RepID=UPI003F6F3964
MRVLTRIGVAGVALLAAACGREPAYAPVSGRVTLDGKPLADAAVVFQPTGRGRDDAGGYGSSGKTDKDGRFTLRVAGPVEAAGALVGPHRVSVTTRVAESAPGSDEIDSKKGGERVPARYNANSELTFEVPAVGTTTADLDLKSK